MFDSNLYGWVDLSLILAGRDVIEITRVKYARKADKEGVYGKGGKPLAIKRGNDSYDLEIEMLDGGYDLLVAASPMGDITRLKQVTAAVTFGNPAEGRPPRTATIIGISFTEGGKEVAQGDKSVKVSLPAIAMDIIE
ncbi:hypothetical protein ABDK00_016900 [Niabella insulamsoli]|uniref:hypothetical protein n=1 Tax=Niabella insulamsoli TaxID=3144874 RepID=UPI0031FCE5AE